MVHVLRATRVCIIMSENFSSRVRLISSVNLFSSVAHDAPTIEGAFEIAEGHLLAAGKRDSARLLADMFVQWSATGGAPGAFALRGTIP